MLDLEKRQADRKRREIERLKNEDVIDPNPSDHGGEAQDPATFENKDDGTGKHANAGANGALGSREEGTAGKGSWPTKAAKKDPTA